MWDVGVCGGHRGRERRERGERERGREGEREREREREKTKKQQQLAVAGTLVSSFLTAHSYMSLRSVKYSLAYAGVLPDRGVDR